METRFNGKVVPFASGASSGERTIFGDWSTSSDDINANLNADFIVGWENGLEGTLNPYPPSQYFNAALYTVSSLVSYLYQQGVSEWNASQDYFINSFCVGSNGKLYRAKTGTSGTPNINKNPTTDTVNWEDFLGASKLLDLIRTVDGTGSGLDADKLNGRTFNWIGQGGQPTWLWGGNDGLNMYIYNPSNFNVNSANSVNTLINHQWASHDTNGYIRLSTGLILQWGYNGTGQSSGTQYYPVALSRVVFVVASAVHDTVINDGQMAVTKVRSYNGSYFNFASGVESGGNDVFNPVGLGFTFFVVGW